MPTKTSPRRKPAAKSSTKAAVAAASTEPQASRPQMKNYGIAREKKGMLAWREYAAERLRASRNYWVATTRPDGRPHVMPVWGFWLAVDGEERFYFGSDRTSRKMRNLARNPNIVVHLESGDEALIIEGRAREVDLRAEPALRKALDAASRAKYDMPLFMPPTAVLYTVQPVKAFGWRERDFPKSATRWQF